MCREAKIDMTDMTDGKDKAPTMFSSKHTPKGNLMRADEKSMDFSVDLTP